MAVHSMTDSETELDSSKKRRRLTNTEFEVSDSHESDAQISLSRHSDRKFCPHCREEVSLKTFKFHKRLYFDQV